MGSEMALECECKDSCLDASLADPRVSRSGGILIGSRRLCRSLHMRFRVQGLGSRVWGLGVVGFLLERGGDEGHWRLPPLLSGSGVSV